MKTHHTLPIGSYYLMLFSVIAVWGISPTIYTLFLRSFSASLLSTLCTFGSTVMFFFMARRKLKFLNRKFLSTALPISLMNAVACVMQRIGLQYTDPSSYAFLEHLSCAVVPIMLFFLLRKKPTLSEWVSCGMCLVGCFILGGIKFGTQIPVGIGDLLCGGAGITFGVCIALTAVSARGLDIHLFMMIHMVCYFGVSLLSTILLNAIRIDGTPLEAVRYVMDPALITRILLVGLLDVGICWLAKTEATRNLDPTLIATTGPLAAIITAVLSVSLGLEKVSTNLIVGAVLISSSVLLSGIEDLIEIRKAKSTAT